MRTAIYVRVSTEDQNTNFSIPSQRKECIKRAEELGATEIREFIDDGYSAAFLDRPGMNALRDAVKNKEVELFVCHDPDRFARNLSHQLIITEEIEKSGAKIEFVNSDYKNTPEGKLFYSIRGAFSEYEREKIKERSMRGKKAKAEAGKIVNNVKPYGYRFNKESSTYEIHKEEAEMVQLIYKWYIEDKIGLLKIAERLVAYGYKTRKGSSNWTFKSVSNILNNEMYTGTAYAFKEQKQKVGPNKYERTPKPREEWIPIPIPPIIDHATFELAQQQATLNLKLSDRNNKTKNLLRGLIECPLCGSRYRYCTEKKGQDNVKYHYFRCYTGKTHSTKYLNGNPNPPCKVRNLPAKVIEQKFWDEMVELSSNPELLLNILEETLETSTANLQEIQLALEKISEQELKTVSEKEKIIKLFREDLITEKEAENELKDIKNKVNILNKEKKKLELNLHNNLETFQSKDALIEKLKFFSGKLSDADYELAREAVLSTVEKVVAQRVDTNYGGEPEIEFRIKFNL